MTSDCSYCHGIRLVGWSGAGPILCPECSRNQDAFTVITQAWREQRAEVVRLSAELARGREAVEMLREVEWSATWQHMDSNYQVTDACPDCGHRKLEGHAPDCRLANVIGDSA